MKHLITALQALQQLPQDSNQCEKYVLSSQIEMLICSENEESQSEKLFRKLDYITKTYHFNYEREFFKLRYAETLYFRDTARAYIMAEECQNNLQKLCGSEDKFYLWAKMDCEYLRFVLKLPDANLKALQDAHHALRHNFFNDYRKRLLAFACIYYAADLLPNGDEILFSDISTLRDMRPRQAAFYAETMALRYALQGKFDLANQELQKAAELFKYFPSYLTVIYHNQRILKNGLFSNSKVKFCSENTCSDGSYCIDPRCIW